MVKIELIDEFAPRWKKLMPKLKMVPKMEILYENSGKELAFLKGLPKMPENVTLKIPRLSITSDLSRNPSSVVTGIISSKILPTISGEDQQCQKLSELNLEKLEVKYPKFYEEPYISPEEHFDSIAKFISHVPSVKEVLFDTHLRNSHYKEIPEAL